MNRAGIFETAVKKCQETIGQGCPPEQFTLLIRAMNLFAAEKLGTVKRIYDGMEWQNGEEVTARWKKHIEEQDDYSAFDPPTEKS